MRFVAAYARGGSVAAAAKAAGVKERSGWNWMAEPGVRAEIASVCADIRERVIEELGGKVHEAVAALAAIMGDAGQSGSVRVSAAVGILSAAVRLSLRQAQGPEERGEAREIKALFEAVAVRWELYGEE